MKENNFFLANNVRQFFFYVSSKEFFVLCFPCTLPFAVFSGQHIFHQFRQQTFFFAHIFNKLFFLTFVATNYFFHFFPRPPSPRYQIVRPLPTASLG